MLNTKSLLKPHIIIHVKQQTNPMIIQKKAETLLPKLIIV